MKTNRTDIQELANKWKGENTKKNFLSASISVIW
jgi:hypothetical protein